MARNPLTRLLEVVGIKDPAKELSPEEMGTLENWKRILSQGEMTIEKIKEFCEYQLTLIEGQFRDTEKTDREKANLTLIHSVYSTMRTVILSPEAEREALEKHLNSLIHSKTLGKLDG